MHNLVVDNRMSLDEYEVYEEANDQFNGCPEGEVYIDALTAEADKAEGGRRRQAMIQRAAEREDLVITRPHRGVRAERFEARRPAGFLNLV